MNSNDEPVPLLPPMTEDEIEAFYRKAKKIPLTAEEVAFFCNPVDTMPMPEVIAELEEIIRKRQEAGTLP